MIIVHLQYEVQTTKGVTLSSYWKNIDMPAAPTQDLAFNDGNFVFFPNRTIQYSIEDQTYFARCVEKIPQTHDDALKMDEMFKKLGWQKNKNRLAA